MPDPSAEIYGSGHVPWRSDTERMLLVKLNLATSAGGGGGGGAIFSGHYGGVMPVTPIPGAGVTAALNYDLDPPFQTWKWSGTDWSG